MKKALWMLFLVLPVALAGLSACGSPRVVVVTATPSPTPAIITVVVTPEPPTPTPTPSPTAMPEQERIPVVSPITLSGTKNGDLLEYSIHVPFKDADGDASRVHHEIVSSTSADVHVEDGTVEVDPAVQQHGSSVEGTWECGEEKYTVVLAITIQDAAGHASAPQQVTIDCPGVEPTATPTPVDTPTPEPSPTPEATWTPWPTEPPLGPAEIRGSLPDSIPCDSMGEGSCEWNWTITFTNESGTNGTIGQIGRRYVDVNGQEWISESGEWQTEEIVVWAYSTNSYSSWVRTYGDHGPDEPDLRGATLIVSWKGQDSQGNAFSGSTTAVLAAGP